MNLDGTRDFRQEQSRYSLNAIVALIAAFFILFVGVLVIGIVQARNEAQRSAESRADAASQVVATNTKWIVELARQALQRIDYAVGGDIAMVREPAVQDIADAVQSLPGSVKAYAASKLGCGTKAASHGVSATTPWSMTLSMQIDEVTSDMHCRELALSVWKELCPCNKTVQDKAAFGGLRVLRDQLVTIVEAPLARRQSVDQLAFFGTQLIPTFECARQGAKFSCHLHALSYRSAASSIWANRVARI